MTSARKEQHRAQDRLDAAHHQLDGIGPFALLRRHGRQEKSAALGAIERHGSDLARATGRVTAAEEHLDQMRDEVAQADAWGTDHDWRRARLRAIEGELTNAGHIDLRRIPLPEQSPVCHLGRSRTSAVASPLDCIRTGDEPNPGLPPWLDRWAEIARPPAPDRGMGLDLGL